MDDMVSPYWNMSKLFSTYGVIHPTQDPSPNPTPPVDFMCLKALPAQTFLYLTPHYQD